jgi:hypothetical protein
VDARKWIPLMLRGGVVRAATTNDRICSCHLSNTHSVDNNSADRGSAPVTDACTETYAPDVLDAVTQTESIDIHASSTHKKCAVQFKQFTSADVTQQQHTVCGKASASTVNENRMLRCKLVTALARLAAQRRTIDRLQQHPVRQPVASPRAFSVDCVNNSSVPGLFKFYTGFPYLTFMTIFSCLVPCGTTCPFKFSRHIPSLTHISFQDQLFFVLCRLRNAFTFKDLSFRIGISPQDICVLCSSWINFMFFTFGSISIWPHRDIICSKMPNKFKSVFPNTIAIIDATEIKLQRPSSLVCQSQCYSDYKSTNTLKGLLGIDPRGSIIFISTLFSGSISDNRLTHDSGLLKLLGNYIDAGYLQPGDSIMCDKGFTNADDFAKLGLKLNVPPICHGQGQMSTADVATTRTIASHRIHVERAIARIKQFRILSHQISISNCTQVNQIWLVCAYLTNFQPFLVCD